MLVQRLRTGIAPHPSRVLGSSSEVASPWVGALTRVRADRAVLAFDGCHWATAASPAQLCHVALGAGRLWRPPQQRVPPGQACGDVMRQHSLI
eukprot:scaffold153202_cov33-Tisochrysis_lutea.AAC.3